MWTWSEVGRPCSKDLRFKVLLSCPLSMVEPSTALWCSTQWTAPQSPTYNVMLLPAAPMSLSLGSMASSELFLHFGQIGDPSRTQRGSVRVCLVPSKNGLPRQWDPWVQTTTAC